MGFSVGTYERSTKTLHSPTETAEIPTLGPGFRV